MKEFLQWAKRAGKIPPECGWHCSMGLGPLLKGKVQEYQLHLSLLPEGRCCVILCLTLLVPFLPHHDGLDSNWEPG